MTKRQVSCFFLTYGVECLTCSKFDLSGSRDHLIPHMLSYWWFFGPKHLSLTVSEIFNGECNAMVYVTLNDL